MAEVVTAVYDQVGEFFSRKVKIVILTILTYAALC